jgi:hypothetical protein
MNVISMMMVDRGKSIDWVNIMFRHLHKKLVRWITFQTKMLKSIMKIDVKKGCMSFYIGHRNVDVVFLLKK